MVDLGLIGSGFMEARNNDLAKRREVAKLFGDFRAANPYASYEDYQMFLDTVAPDRFTRGGITQDHLQRLAQQNQTKKQRDDARIALEDQRKQLDLENLQTDTVMKAIDRVANTGKDGQDYRKLVIDQLGPAAQNPRVAAVLAGMDIEGEVKRRKLQKTVTEREQVTKIAGTFDDPNKSPEEIERDMVVAGVNPDQARSAAGQISKKRDDDYNMKKSGLLDDLTKDASVGHIILGEQQGDLPSIIRQRAEAKGIKLRPDDDRTLAGTLQSRRDEYERIATDQFQKSVKDLQALAADEVKTPDESTLRQKYANLPKRQQDYIVEKWKEGRQAYIAESKDKVIVRLDDTKDSDLRNTLQDGNRQQVEAAVKAAIERTNPDLAKDQSFIDQTVDQLLKRGATRAGEAAIKYNETARTQAEANFNETSKSVSERLGKVAGDFDKSKKPREAAAYKIGSLVAEQTNMSDTEVMRQVEEHLKAFPDAKDDIGKAAAEIVAKNGSRTKAGVVTQAMNNRSGIDMSSELSLAREAGASAEATLARVSTFRQMLSTKVDELGRPLTEDLVFRGLGRDGTKSSAVLNMGAALEQIIDKIRRIDTITRSNVETRYNRANVNLDDFAEARAKLVKAANTLQETIKQAQGWQPFQPQAPVDASGLGSTGVTGAVSGATGGLTDALFGPSNPVIYGPASAIKRGLQSISTPVDPTTLEPLDQ